jgi:hypothetical protein
MTVRRIALTALAATAPLTDVPLLTARQDLTLAQRALKSKDLTAASSDLRQASQSLDAYKSSRHSADARRLAAENRFSHPGDRSCRVGNDSPALLRVERPFADRGASVAVSSFT